MIGQAARKLPPGPERLVAVLEAVLPLLGQVMVAVIAIAATGDDRPGDAISRIQRLIGGIDPRRVRPEGDDPAEDLVAEDRWDRYRSTAVDAVQVAAAERAGDHLDEDF